MRRAVFPLLAASLVVVSCVIAEAPADVPKLPEYRPSIVKGGVVPTSSRVLTEFPAKFIPQVPQWAIREFSRSLDTMWDPFMGSGTTAISALNLGRDYLGLELSPEYCRDARIRIAEHKAKLRLH